MPTKTPDDIIKDSMTGIIEKQIETIIRSSVLIQVRLGEATNLDEIWDALPEGEQEELLRLAGILCPPHPPQ